MITLLLMIIGYIGVIVPGLPGGALIFIGTCIYAYVTDFTIINGWYLGIFGFLTLIAMVADYVSGLISAKKFGATKYGLYGSLIGGIIGMIAASIPGLILGQILGVVVGEIYFGKQLQASLKAGIGVFIGFLLGSVVQLVSATLIVLIFLFKVIIKVFGS